MKSEKNAATDKLNVLKWNQKDNSGKMKWA